MVNCEPGCGFPGDLVSIDDLIAAANVSLGSYGNTPKGHAQRAYQECLKNALDAGNNNLNFVQSTPCEFSFGE